MASGAAPTAGGSLFLDVMFVRAKEALRFQTPKINRKSVMFWEKMNSAQFVAT